MLRAEGKASDHACADCGKPARDRSYDGLDPDEVVEADGNACATRPNPNTTFPGATTAIGCTTAMSDRATPTQT